MFLLMLAKAGPHAEQFFKRETCKSAIVMIVVDIMECNHKSQGVMNVGLSFWLMIDEIDDDGVIT